MELRDPDIWEHWVADNPPPDLGPDPLAWPNEDMDMEQMGTAYAYVTIWAAKAWAEEMERRLPPGEPDFTDIASEAWVAITDTGIPWTQLTGYQYGLVIAILARCWVHGEALRRWHNLSIQIHHEGESANEQGGVLNPALLVMGTPPEPEGRAG